MIFDVHFAISWISLLYKKVLKNMLKMLMQSETLPSFL